VKDHFMLSTRITEKVEAALTRHSVIPAWRRAKLCGPPASSSRSTQSFGAALQGFAEEDTPREIG